MSLLPDTIPAALGSVTGLPAPTAGNGWEVKVLAHTDFSTLICELPSFTSLQFAKLLKDKGSGTVTLSMDDPALFPPGVLSLNPNPDFADGLVDDWDGVNATVAVVATPGATEQAFCIQVAPSGTAQTCYAAEDDSPFPVVPGQRYVTAAQAYLTAPGGGSAIGPSLPPAVTGMVFLDSSGAATVVLGAPALVVTAWSQVYGAVTAPEGAVTGYPLVGLTSSPGSGYRLYAASVSTTYDSTEFPGTPGSATLGEYVLDHEHLFQVFQYGLLRFEFTGQSVTEQLVDESEQRVATVQGPGTANVLSWARALPPGFPDIVFKTDAIQDGFAEIDTKGNPLLDTNIWDLCSPLDSQGVPTRITLSPPGTALLTARPGTTFLGASPYDITSSSFSAQLIPMSDPGLDGSQVTQLYVQDPADPGNYALIGLSATEFYCQLGDTASRVQATKRLSNYSADTHAYWRLSEKNGVFYFWTSAGADHWTLQWKHAYSWDASRVDLFIAATYDRDSQATVGVTNVNSEVVTPSSAGNIFLLTPILGVWRKLFDAAQSRGTIPWVSSKLSHTTDSFGNPWPDAMSVQIQNGTDLYSLLQTHAGIVNADWVMQPGFDLQVGLPVSKAGGVSLGRDLSRQVVIREAAQEVSRQRVRARDQVTNLVGAVNSDGVVVSATDAVSITSYGQREGWVQTAQVVNPEAMDVVVAATLDQTKDEVLSKTVTIVADRPGATPFVDFDVADWVGQERSGVGLSVTDAVRVVGIAVGIDATGLVSCELTISTYRQWLGEQLQYLVDKFGGQFINAAGTVPVTSTALSDTGVPIDVAPSLGGLSDVVTGTTHLDPLVWNAIAGTWQNASNDGPTGAPIGMAVGDPVGSQVSLVPAAGQTVIVAGDPATKYGQILAAYQMQSGADSESVPGYVASVVFFAGQVNEQLGMLTVSGLAQATAQAMLMTSDSADGTINGAVRHGTIIPGATTLSGGPADATTATWQLTSTLMVFPHSKIIQVAPGYTFRGTDPTGSGGAEDWHSHTSFGSSWAGTFNFMQAPFGAGMMVFVQFYFATVGTTVDDTLLFTLPAAYAPTGGVRVNGASDAQKANGTGGFETPHIRVQPDGTVRAWGLSTNSSFFAGSGLYPLGI